jgi:hypothetical protein
MNSRIVFWAVWVSLLLWGCSNDDAESQVFEMELSVPGFQLIGEDEASILLYSFDGTSETGAAVNLTQEDGVDRFYITLRQVADALSFYSIFNGSFSLLQKNISTDETNAVDDFISIDGEHSVIWGSNSETQILIGYYSPPGSGEYGVRALDIVTRAFIDTPLASNVFDTLDPLYFNQRLFAAYLDNNDRYHLVVFNTEEASIVRSFDFGDQIPAFLIDDFGNFVLLIGRDGIFSKEIYSIQNMDLLMSDTFQLSEFFEPGPLEAYLMQNKLYYQSALVQPAPVPSTPAILDFDTGLRHTVDILSIREIVMQEIGGDIIPTAFGYRTENSVFLMGYAKATNNISFEGGVLAISESGGLIQALELPFVPTYFIKN